MNLIAFTVLYKINKIDFTGKEKLNLLHRVNPWWWGGQLWEHL